MVSPSTAARRAVDGVRATAEAIRAVAPHRFRVAIRAMFSMTLPLAIGAATGHPAWGALASMGGFAGFYAPDAPYRYRARLVAGIGAGLTAGVLLGGLSSSQGWLAPLVAGAVAAVASLACQAAEVPLPREYLIVLATLAATGIPVGPREAVWNAGLTATGAVIGWLVTMSPVLGRARAPERRAVRAALAAVASLLASAGRSDPRAARHAAVTAVRRARRVVMQGALPADHRLTRTVMATEALLEAALQVEASTRLDPGWAMGVRALCPAVGRAPVPDDPLPDSGDPVLREAVLRVRAALARSAPTAPGDEPVGLPDWPGFLPQLRAAVRRHSVVVPAAVRLGVAVAAGAGLGRALGLDHSYWVGLTASAVLLATNSAGTVRRSVHRVAGTVAGVALTYALFGWHPPLAVIVAGVAFIQFASEMVITASYGLAVVGITVLALVLFHLGAPGADLGDALSSRLADTLVGTLLALILRAVLWPRATAARLPQVQARTLRSVSRVLHATWTGDGTRRRVADERRRLQSDLVTLRAVHTDALADDRSASPDTDLRWPVTVGIEELAFLALSYPKARPAPAADLALRVEQRLEELASAVGGDGPAPAAGALEVPGYPRATAALASLSTAVAHASTPPDRAVSTNS
ncbi:hypothetical protein HC028_16990 [Planosporangium flavigriseum]|uniref:Integral membrane bound transporter domain-containing protein n=1 Tax=Planosporangium flavigriseum TaxID=373681 RepID=A0A8J3LPH1_9ACTN|nr:FUSC family protein [Planosporangium flavigriseum]NJC66189.1 hypothetical protein [Planosporangium flavigriseum]GIG75119.1 hypothetical protein Pfl04_35230 [Planosporangium flavigriseum]